MMATFSGRHKCFHNGIILIVICSNSCCKYSEKQSYNQIFFGFYTTDVIIFAKFVIYYSIHQYITQ